MKKLLTLALALVALAVFAGLSVGQDKQKVLTGKVTQVNKEHKTFTVEVTFSTKAAPLPKKEEKVDVIYTPNPTGGPPEATTVKSQGKEGSVAKATHGETRNEELGSGASSDRLTAGQSGVTGKVMAVNAKNNTFTVEVTFDGKELKGPLPEAGKIYDITFNQPTPGGSLKPTTIKGSKSNSSSY